MDNRQHGAGTSEVMVIIALLVYFMFMGYLGNATGHTVPIIGSLSSWQLPYATIGSHWYSFILGIGDFLIAIANIFGWIIGSLVSYAALIGFSVGGEPAWITAFLFTPVAFGMGWLVMSLMRGRE